MAHLNRRHVLTGVSALTGLAAMSGAGCINISTQDIPQSKPGDWTLGFQNTSGSFLGTNQVNRVNGRIPKGLRGDFYRNGPAIRQRGNTSVQHWFDGDGMVQKFSLGEDRISHIGRIVETEKYLTDKEAGRITSNGFGTSVENPTPPTSADSANQANTSIIKVGDDLLALWEGGSAYRVDLETLETKGVKSWVEGMPAMPFSAHPKVEPNGTIWNFGQDAFGKRLLIYKISPSGDFQGLSEIAEVPGGMMHDFCMTERHLIFMLPSLRATKQGVDYLSCFTWMPNEAQRVVVVEKDDLSKRRDFELPPGLQFHFGNAYEEKNGDIRFSFCTTEPEFLLTGLKEVLLERVPAPAKGKVTQAVLRMNGNAEITSEISQMGDHEFPQFNPNYTGQFTRYLYTVGQNHMDRPLQSAILRHDIETGDVQSFDYGKTAFAEEHLFIPRPSSTDEDDGWLIGTVLDFAKGSTQLNILDAQHISDGPLAIFDLPYVLPLGFHGTWVGANV